MNLIPIDTSVETIKKQFDILNRLKPEDRLAMTFELSNNLRSIVEAGVKLRHPDYNELQIQRKVLYLMIGDSVFKNSPDAGKQT